MLIRLYNLVVLFFIADLIPGEKEIRNATDDIWLKPAGWVITAISLGACAVAGYFIIGLVKQRKEDRAALDKATSDKVQLAGSSATMIERCVNELREMRKDLDDVKTDFKDGVKRVEDKLEELWKYLIGRGKGGG